MAKIDNYALTMHQTCPSKFDLRMNQGYTTRGKRASLGFGGAIHTGLAVWYKSGSLGAAIAEIEDKWPEGHDPEDWRSKSKCIAVMKEYAATYPTETWRPVGIETGNPLIEVPFTLDLGLSLSHCHNPDCDFENKPNATVCANCLQNLEPIEYGGIFDGLVQFSGQVFVLEHKTTTMMGIYYFSQFKPNNQVTGYCWAANQMSGMRVQGAIINAIGLSKTGTTKFNRELTSRSPAAIEEWKRNVQSVCNEIDYHRRTGFWPMRTNACTLYGLCEFHAVHSLEHADEREKRLETEYIKEEWDYELRET